MNFTKWFSGTWLSCQQYAKRMSQALDNTLPREEWCGYIFHHYWCFNCRRFKKQVEHIEETVSQIDKMYQSGKFEESVTLGDLSKERKEKIAQSLREIQGRQ